MTTKREDAESIVEDEEVIKGLDLKSQAEDELLVVKSEDMDEDEMDGNKKKKEDASAEISQMKEVSNRIKELEAGLSEKEETLRERMMVIPNVPHESVVVGQGDTDNKEIRKWGEKPIFSFQPKAHWDIGEDLDILDFNRGAKIPAPALPFIKVPERGWSGP